LLLFEFETEKSTSPTRYKTIISRAVVDLVWRSGSEVWNMHEDGGKLICRQWCGQNLQKCVENTSYETTQEQKSRRFGVKEK
jgi:hypothetical protein